MSIFLHKILFLSLLVEVSIIKSVELICVYGHVYTAFQTKITQIENFT